MSKAFIDDTNLTDIADAIRSKLGVSDTYLPSEMAGAIQSIPKRKVIDFNITPKTLDNAEQNSLQYVKAYGGTEQQNLPDGYTELEYIESTGTQYINTNYKGNANTKVELTIGNVTSLVEGGLNGIFGYFYFGARWDSLNVFRCGFGSTSWQNTTVTQIDKNTIVFSYDEATYNGVSINRGFGSLFSGMTIPIFAYWESSTRLQTSKMKLYDFKLYESGVIKLCLIPAKRISDNVIGMYDTVTQAFFTNAGTGDFIAGPYITAPTPENPVDIVCNNGVIKVSGNLFNKYTCTDGYYYNASLQYTSNNILSLSDYIPVVPGNVYVLSGHTNITLNLRVNFFNSSKEIISQDVYNNLTDDYELSVTIPTNIYYVRYSFSITQKNSQQFELGTSATTYHSYGEIYTEGDTETINIGSENLVDFTSLTIIPNTAISETGELVSNSGVNFCESYISVLPNQTYKISGDILGGNIGQQTYYFRLASYDVDKIFISSSDTVTGTEYTFTTNSTTKYIRFHYINTATLNTYKFQLNNTATCERLLALNGYTDTQEILSGIVNRKIGIKVLDGTESWSLGGNNTGVWRAFEQVGTFDITDAICGHFQYTTGGDVNIVDMLQDHFCLYSNGNISFKSSNTTNVNTWKGWLQSQYISGTPVIIVYPLTTETTETVTPQPMTNAAGDNTLEITQSSLLNLEVECEYFIQ